MRNKTQAAPRGRPSTRQKRRKKSSSQAIIEETTKIFDPLLGTKQEGKIPLPPGSVEFSDQFINFWDKTAGKEDIEEVTVPLMRFVRKFVRTSIESQDKISPNAEPENCCSQCGVNHEVRDFIRAACLRIVDEMEKTEDYVNYLKENSFITDEAFNHAIANIPKDTKMSQSAILKKDVHENLGPTEPSLEDIEVIGPSTLKKLHEVGISSLKDLALSNIEQLAEKINSTKDTARAFILAAQNILRHSMTSGQSKKTAADSLILEDVQGVGRKTAKKLRQLGIESVLDLAKANAEQLAEQLFYSEDVTKSLILDARKLLKESGYKI